MFIVALPKLEEKSALFVPCRETTQDFLSRFQTEWDDVLLAWLVVAVGREALLVGH